MRRGSRFIFIFPFLFWTPIFFITGFSFLSSFHLEQVCQSGRSFQAPFRLLTVAGSSSSEIFSTLFPYFLPLLPFKSFGGRAVSKSSSSCRFLVLAFFAEFRVLGLSIGVLLSSNLPSLTLAFFLLLFALTFR